jgi:hypothetical protein
LVVSAAFSYCKQMITHRYEDAVII